MAELQLTTREQAIYLFALRLLPGIGPQTVLLLARKVSHLQTIPELSTADLKSMLGASLAQKVRSTIGSQWEKSYLAAQSIIDQHLEKDIHPLPITSDDYPILLKQIKDPPAILYAKGNLAALNTLYAVAVIGTRGPTKRGLDMARLIANNCAKHGCVIVSGLAKGIDTAAHQGAIDVGGQTVAVFATPLDQVYPAENKKLADTIYKEAGVLVSELPLGTASWKGTFVLRDRIQSGLSLGVIAVQTDIEGGTMHTVRFAGEQNRLRFCPPPSEEEKQVAQNKGILFLLEQKKAYPFPTNYTGIYERLLERLEEQRKILISPEVEALPPSQKQAAVEQQLELTAPPSEPVSEADRVLEQPAATMITIHQPFEQAAEVAKSEAEPTTLHVQAAKSSEIDEHMPETIDTPTTEAELLTDAIEQAPRSDTKIQAAEVAKPGAEEPENHPSQPPSAIPHAEPEQPVQQSSQSTESKSAMNGTIAIAQGGNGAEPLQAGVTNPTTPTSLQPLFSGAPSLVDNISESKNASTPRRGPKGQKKGSSSKSTNSHDQKKIPKPGNNKKAEKRSVKQTGQENDQNKTSLWSLDSEASQMTTS